MKNRKLITLILSIIGCGAFAFGLSACGEEKPSEPVHTHSYTQSVVAPTCTEKGYTKHTCSCGDTYSDAYVNALGHSFTNYVSNNDETKTAVCDHGCGTKDTIVEGLVVTFNSADNAYSVTDYTGTATKVCIPVTHKGVPITRIYSSAFEGCSSLTEIVVPNSVTSIASSAFEGCVSLKQIVIPDSVTSIGSQVFDGCSSLTEIVIPDSVTNMGYCSFENCLTIYCEVESKPSGWDSDWNMLNRPVVWDCNNNDVATDGYIYTIVDGLRYALKDGVAIATRQSINIATANISKTVTYKSVDYSVTSIGNSSFSWCNSLTEIVIPDSVTSIGNYAFAYCDNLTEIIIPDGVTGIGDRAFTDCDNLTEIIIPDSVTRIGKSAFSGCNSSIYTTYNDCTYVSINGNAYFLLVQVVNKNLNAYTIHENTKFIGEYAFSWCESLTEVVVGDGVTSIGSSAFEYCCNLTEVVIGDGVTSIGSSVFDYCSSLTEIKVDENNENYKDIDGNLYTKDGKMLIQYAIGKTATFFTIPDDATSIAERAFANCSGLTEIVIPDSVKSIGKDAFSFCNKLRQVYITDINAWCNISFGNSSANPLCYGASLYLNNNLVTKIVVPNTVTEIKDYAFYCCESLTEIVIPDSVTRIGDYAFVDCRGLTEIVIPDSVTTIGVSAFQSCRSLTEIVIPDRVKAIDDSAFSGCNNLTEIVIPDSVTTIGDKAFYNCSSLTEVVIPDSVTTIGDKAFFQCHNLTIYCETKSKPSGWDSDWNYSNRPVVWGYTGE